MRDRALVRSGGGTHGDVTESGIMTTPEARTQDGIELEFATNFLGHFALSLGLHGALMAAGAPAWCR